MVFTTIYKLHWWTILFDSKVLFLWIMLLWTVLCKSMSSFLIYILIGEVTVLYDSFICNFLKFCQPVFQCTCTIFLSFQKYMKVPISSNPCPHLLLSIFFFSFFSAAPVIYGSSWGYGWIWAAAASLHHSHSNAKSEPHLWPTLKLVVTPDH